MHISEPLILMFMQPVAHLSYLTDVDAVVDRPGRLETLHHALLQSLG